MVLNHPRENKSTSINLYEVPKYGRHDFMFFQKCSQIEVNKCARLPVFYLDVSGSGIARLKKVGSGPKMNRFRQHWISRVRFSTLRC